MRNDDLLEDYYDDHSQEDYQPKSRKTLSIKLLILTLISVVGYSMVGNTFAANVQLGSGRVEFGQGIQTSTACDSRIVVTPFATFANAAGAAANYKLTDIQVTDISNGCYGKDFIIRAYDSATATPLDLYQVGGSTNYNLIRVFNNNGLYTLANSGLTQGEIVAVSGGFKVTLFNSASPAAVALAQAVAAQRITLESVEHDSTLTQTLLPSGSLNFNGSTSTIDYASNSAFTLGTGDFTVEAWANLDSSNSNQTFFDAGGNVNGSNSFAFWIENNQLKIRYNGTSNDVLVAMDASWWGSYHHYAAVRGGGKFRIFVDGVKRVEANDLGHSIDRTTPVIGRLSNYAGYELKGNIRNFRLVKGTALYAANFTPPSAPLTKVSGTLLLLLAQNPGSPAADSSDNGFAPSNSANLPGYVAP